MTRPFSLFELFWLASGLNGAHGTLQAAGNDGTSCFTCFGNNDDDDGLGDQIADFMAQPSASLFVDNTLIEKDCVEVERLQVVQYE